MPASEAPSFVGTRSTEEALVARLLDVIGGHAPMADALEVLSPELVSHMDEWTVRGTDVWFDWLDFIRYRAGGQLRLDVDRIRTNPDGTITAFGWLTVGDGRTRQENYAIYRLEGGRIAEIWTTRGNYEMIFGAKVRHRLTWLLVLVEMAIWRRLPWTRRARSPATKRS